LDQRDGAVAVLNVGAVDNHREQQAHGVDEDMAFAAFHLLARVIAARAAALGGLDRLAVDDAGGRTGLAALGFARRHDQRMVDALPGAVLPPGIEIVLHR